MAGSKQGILGFGEQLAPRTPGPWGHNDAGDPNSNRLVLADKPGFAGLADAGVPAIGGVACGDTTYVRRSINDVPTLKFQRTAAYPDGGLTIRGDEAFIEHTLDHLAQIKSTDCGALLLEKLKYLASGKGGGHQFMILSESGARSSEALYKPDAYPKGAQIQAWTDKEHTDRMCFTGTGAGSDVVVHHNDALPTKFDGVDVPRAVSLAHELIHAWHQASGTLATGWADNVWNFERQSVGLGKYYKCADKCSGNITENCIRKQWKPPVPLRLRYGGEEKDVEPNLSGY